MHSNSLTKNAVLNIIYKLSSIIFPLVVYPYVSRILLADNMGRVSFFSSLTNYAIMVGTLGISTYGIRATATVRNDKEQLSLVTKELVTINAIMTGIVLCALLVTFFLVSKFRQNWPLFLISCIQVAFSPFSMEWLYSGLEQYGYITKRAIFIKVISLISIFLFVRRQDDYIVYAIITTLGYIGSYLFNLIYSRKLVNCSVRSKKKLKKHLKSTITLFASMLAINVYTNIDAVMLGFINGDRAVGLYDVSVKGKLVLLSLINAISTVLFPRLSYYISENNQKSYIETLKKSISIICAIAVPMSLFFIIEARDVILVLGGADYIESTLCMQILMPILVISGFSNITGNQILLPHGLDSAFMRAVVIGAVMDVILNAFLMPRYSLYGAATATLVAEIIQMSIQSYQSRRYLKKSVNKLDLTRITIASFFAMLLLMLVKHIFSFGSFVNLLIYSFLFFGVYLILLLLFRMEIIWDAVCFLQNNMRAK